MNIKNFDSPSHHPPQSSALFWQPQRRRRHYLRALCAVVLMALSFSWMLGMSARPAQARSTAEPTVGTTPVLGDIIFNEYATDGSDFVELLVLAPNLDLRGLRITDNELMTGTLTTGESVFTFSNDAFLSEVPGGTVIGVWRVATTTNPVDTTVNAAASDWKLLLAPGTGIITGTDGLGGSNNPTLATTEEAVYLYLPGPDGTSAGTDNVYLDFLAWEGGDGAQTPTGLTYINLPSLADNAFYTGLTALGNDVPTNWSRYNGAPTALTTPGEPNPGQDLSSLRVGDFYPAVSSASPANGATNVPANQLLTFAFNKPVTAGISAFAISCNSVPLNVTGVTGGPGSVFSVTHDAFPVNAVCQITVKAAQVSDVDANDPPDAPQTDYVYSITTAGTDNAPAVTAHSPASGATQVSLKSNIVITFSEPVSVAGNWFEIVCGISGSRSPTQTTESAGPIVFTINPSVDFSPGETCTTTLFAAQVNDKDDLIQPMAANVSFNFTVTSTTGTANAAPTANAGADVTANVSTLVQLNGSASSDADGNMPLTYGWTQVSGSPVTINGANTANPSFTAPATVSSLSFALVVTDALGAASTADTVVVNVVNQPNQAITGLQIAGPLTGNTGSAGSYVASIMAGSNVVYTWTVNGMSAGTGTTLSHTFATAGSYVVAVHAQNGTSSMDSSVTVIVSNASTITLTPKAYLPLLTR